MTEANPRRPCVRRRQEHSLSLFQNTLLRISSERATQTVQINRNISFYTDLNGQDEQQNQSCLSFALGARSIRSIKFHFKNMRKPYNPCTCPSKTYRLKIPREHNIIPNFVRPTACT